MDPLAIVGLVVAGLVVLSLLLWIVGTHNRLITLNNEVDRAWANVDVLLQQRAEEVPNLVATVKGYAKHERELFDAVTQARAGLLAAKGPHDKAEASELLSQAVGKLIAVAEAYPDLKANENFLALQKRLSGLEETLADRREYYNDAVTNYNTRIQEIPGVFFAPRMNLKPRELFRADAAARELPRVQF